ncbi:unnamed protein product [Cochlearia groenlandica]
MMNMKRTATARRRSNEEDGDYCTFNLSSLKHEIDTIGGYKGNTMDLSSLSAALSTASLKVKQTGKKTRKNKNMKKKKNMKVIGMKPETNSELQKWFSNFDESFKRFKEKLNRSSLVEPQKICEFNAMPYHSFFLT